MADKELLREVALELWGSVKKLRPGLPRESRLELTLKALMVIGDLQDQVQAAVVVGVIAEQEPPESEPQGQDVTKPLIQAPRLSKPRMAVVWCVVAPVLPAEFRWIALP